MGGCCSQPSSSADFGSGTGRVVFVMGGPGSGKGTCCAELVKRLGYKHISVGDLLREEQKRPASPHAEQLARSMAEGALVPIGIIEELLVRELKTHVGATVLVDGFPRDLEQAKLFESGNGKPTAVLYFECPRDVLTARLLERANIEGRADDNKETIAKRFTLFDEITKPVVARYDADSDVMVHHINTARELGAVVVDLVMLCEKNLDSGSCE